MMDQSYSESDVSISPSQILDRLQVLRQLQILQRGKLQKHRLQYDNSPEITSSITEIVSQFSNSTSYNTFRSLLQTSQETNEAATNSHTNPSFRKENLQNVIEGVSVLNLSEESEFIANSVSSRNSCSPRQENELSRNASEQNYSKKQISLDEMPILSPKKDFETLITEKLKNEKKITKEMLPTKLDQYENTKKPFLRRGEGMSRFGIKKNDLVIQNTKSLPWKKKTNGNKITAKTKINKPLKKQSANNNVPTQLINKDSNTSNVVKEHKPCDSYKKINVQINHASPKEMTVTEENEQTSSLSGNNLSSKSNIETLATSKPKVKQPTSTFTGKTWASVFTKEQDDFLRQLKQSDYYKNFVSPAKSSVSDMSCNENVLKLKQDRETAEQNLFELIENKVTHESFSINNSFFNRFLKSNIDCSGESTPLVMQKCLYKNPNLLHILPDLAPRERHDTTCSDMGTCNSECSECSENCSSVSSCSCQTVTQANISVSCINECENDEKVNTKKPQRSKVKSQNNEEKEKSHNDTLTAENEVINSNMAEMNAKLIATSDLLKDRLKELEDEIETFRKENTILSKMREEVDMERQKLYEDKNAYEQKFNEEKILSEYYLAEEKEKLNKQKQMYERYVRDMRGRLNKKEKDEVINLKKEIQALKDDIKVKDAKSTSTIARLRNQIKIIEKDKKNLEDEVEKLKKENKRIQHSNDITRRLTNLKYLEQINNKLSSMTSKDTIADIELDPNVKYKAFEIERQSRVRKSYPNAKGTMKLRAKSVPNLHVTSRYAKYFSQKDSLSDKDKNMTLTDKIDCIDKYNIDNDLSNSNDKSNFNDSELSNNDPDSEEENNLEKLYNDRFKSTSSKDPSSNSPVHFDNLERLSDGNSDYFIEKPNKRTSLKSLDHKITSKSHSITHNMRPRSSKSPSIHNRLSQESKSPSSYFSENYDYDNDTNRKSKSPVSILSNHPSSSLKSGTVVNKEVYSDRIIPSPETISSKTTLSRTNLNPTEIRKPDGTRELRFPNGNVKIMSADGNYSKFLYYNGDIKEIFYNEGRIKYFYAETKTFHTTQPDGLEILEFPDGQVEKRYKDGSSEIKLPNGSIRYYDPKNEHVREEWRFPDGASLTVSANGEQRIVFANGQVEVHAKDHKRREFPDGSVKLVYNDGTAETRYASGRIRIKDKHGKLIMDSAPG